LKDEDQKLNENYYTGGATDLDIGHIKFEDDKKSEEMDGNMTSNRGGPINMESMEREVMRSNG
jgi:hypothetical protein